jgi:hypothetical protein
LQAGHRVALCNELRVDGTPRRHTVVVLGQVQYDAGCFQPLQTQVTSLFEGTSPFDTNSVAMSTRPASKASPVHRPNSGWYPGDPEVLGERIDDYLSRVPDAIEGRSVPIPGARIVIAP